MLFYLAGFIAGILINRINCGLVLIFGSLVMAGSIIASSFATGVVYLTLTLGIFMGKFFNVCITKILHSTRSKLLTSKQLGPCCKNEVKVTTCIMRVIKLVLAIDCSQFFYPPIFFFFFSDRQS